MTTLLTGGGTRGREALDDDVDLARDRALVTRAQNGDRTAFDDLYMRYYRRLYRFCLRRLHDSHEAEDVAQEAFARAWRALPTFGGDRRFYPWLSVIASHLCTDVLRRRNRSTPVAEFHQGNIASTDDGGEELMLAAVDSDMVAKAFTRLSDRHQRILHLREGSGWSYQRIADHEGVGITAVETLLWRARQALKREFASLAGADGRTAAWIGGVLSLATLRRLLHMPVHSARRLATSGAKGAILAAGSAVAATAIVVAATLSAPQANQPVNLPVTLSGSTPTFSTQSVIGPGATSTPPGGTGALSASVPAASPASVPAAVPALPVPVGSPSTPLGSLPGSGQVGGTLNTAVGALSSTVSGASGVLSNTLAGVGGGALGSLGSGLVGTATTLLGGAGSTVAGTSGAASATGSAAPSGSTSSGLLGGSLGGVTQSVQGSSAGLLGGG
ncbi:MAG: RNA polymerase sigma factor [Acidimicrobiales bacterium]